MSIATFEAQIKDLGYGNSTGYVDQKIRKAGYTPDNPHFLVYQRTSGGRLTQKDEILVVTRQPLNDNTFDVHYLALPYPELIGPFMSL